MSLSQPFPNQGDNPHIPEDTSGHDQTLVESAVDRGAETAKAGAKWTLDFNTRLKNDEVTKLSAMLAYYFLMSIVPLLVVLLSFIGLVIGHLSPQAQQTLVSKLAHSTPVSQNFIQAALSKLSKSSGVLAVASILISVFTGTRLFLTIDYCFSKVYKVPLRRPLRRWLIAFAMLAVLVVLVPVLLVVSSLPAILSGAVFTRIFGHSTIAGLLVIVVSSLVGLLIASGLFLTIYTIIPNQRLRARDGWKGALVAGVLLAIYISIFPYYASHYLGSGSLAASAGFALVALILCYYFGFILLIGAEMNDFLADRRQGGSGVPAPAVEVEGQGEGQVSRS